MDKATERSNHSTQATQRACSGDGAPGTLEAGRDRVNVSTGKDFGVEDLELEKDH